MLAVALVALVARVVYLSQARGCPLFNVPIVDGRVYVEWAERIARGDWVGSGVFYQAPLYPYLLAGIRATLGDSLEAIRAVQTCMGVASCVFLFLAGRLFFSRPAAMIAALLLAVYPPAIFYDSIIQKAALGTFLVTLLLWLLGRIATHRTPARAAAAGACLGLLVLTREESLLLVPVLTAWLLATQRVQRWRRRILLGGALLAGLCAVLSPVTVRNYMVSKELVLTTSQAGTNLYIGNHEGATGVYEPLRPGRSNTIYERQDAFELARQALGYEPTAREVSRYWTGRAVSFMTGHPSEWIRLMARKAALLVNAYEVPDADDQYFYEQYSGLLRAASWLLHLGIVVPLAGAGIVLTLPHRARLMPLYLLLGTTACAVVAFYVFGRYRFPIVPPLLLFTGAAIVHVRNRNFTPLRLYSAIAAAITLAVVANWPMYDRSWQLGTSYANASAALAEQGDSGGSLALAQKGVALSPDNPDLHLSLARAQARTGDTQRAIKSLQSALALRPGDARSEHDLGTLLAESGDLLGGLQHLRRAADLAPSDHDTWVNLANVQFMLGQWREGIGTLNRVVQQWPEDVTATSSLAWVLATCPDVSQRNAAEAVRIAEGANARTGNEHPEVLDILAAAYALAGKFDDAVSTATRALEHARRMKADGVAAQIGERLELYKQGKAN